MHLSANRRINTKADRHSLTAHTQTCHSLSVVSMHKIAITGAHPHVMETDVQSHKATNLLMQYGCKICMMFLCSYSRRYKLQRSS